MSCSNRSNRVQFKLFTRIISALAEAAVETFLETCPFGLSMVPHSYFAQPINEQRRDNLEASTTRIFNYPSSSFSNCNYIIVFCYSVAQNVSSHSRTDQIEINIRDRSGTRREILSSL